MPPTKQPTHTVTYESNFHSPGKTAHVRIPAGQTLTQYLDDLAYAVYQDHNPIARRRLTAIEKRFCGSRANGCGCSVREVSNG